jgi:signal transduction histidine kinase
MLTRRHFLKTTAASAAVFASPLKLERAANTPVRQSACVSSMFFQESRRLLDIIQHSTELLVPYTHSLSDEKNLRQLYTIKPAIEQIRDLLDNGLLYKRLESYSKKNELQPMNLVDLCQECIDQFTLCYQQNPLVFVSKCGCHNTKIRKYLLNRMLETLFSNIIKYSSPGNPIQLDLICTSSSAVFRFQDRNSNISSEERKQLSEFFDQDNPDEFNVNELDLAILRKLAKLHYGKITVNRGVAVGNTLAITVSLPLDFFERRQVEIESSQVGEKEEEYLEKHSIFGAYFSSGFRTPLTMLQSSAEMLEGYHQKLSGEKRLRHFLHIQNAIKDLTQMLNDMWIIESIENGKLTWQPASMDLVCFCRHLVKDFQLSSSPQRQLTFVSQGDCINVQMDENLLRNIITNLLSNAIKFSPQESPVQFDLGYNSCSAIFRIQDSGIGISLEDKERIFEVFTIGRNVGCITGSGLGLATVKKCVDLHRGQITVQSVVDVGTTFTVTLPLKATIA